MRRMAFEGKAELLRRNWIVTGFTIAVAAAGGAMAASGALFGIFLSAFSVVFGLLVFARDAFPRATSVSYRVSAEELTIGNETIAGADILEAKALPLPHHAVIALTLRDRRVVRLRLASGQVRDFVDILQARRARFRLVTSWAHRFLGCFTAFFALWFLGGFAHAQRHFGSTVFMLLIAADRIGVLLSPLRLARRIHPNAEMGAEGRALMTHLAAALARSQQTNGGTPDVRALVERGSRSTKEWLSGIDGLVAGGAARYRVAQLSADSLLAVATDPNASHEARVGAATALIRSNDDELRVRVRVCAESCTDRALRETMLALSEARDDEATETALAALRL